MHSAPAVSYPVGRSRLQVGLVVTLGVSGAIGGLLWGDPSGLIRWRQLMFALLFFAAWLNAANAWWRSPVGSLCWDGQVWIWIAERAKPCAALKVHIDLQFCLLVSVVLADGKRLWLWPERSTDAVQWAALRRAVFCRSPA